MAFDKHASPDTKQYHIQVARGEVGRYVFLPGDPFRTDLIASFLEDAKLIAHNREHKNSSRRGQIHLSALERQALCGTVQTASGMTA